MPFIVVFVASASVMIIEIAASRLIAQYVGSNLYTWTSIIAVVLAGLSVGNLGGGLLADRLRAGGAATAVAVALVSAGLFALVSLAILGPVFQTLLPGFALPVRVLAGVASVFLVPSIVLGAISPLAATWAIKTHEQLGLTVGTLYAVSSFGAIVGTLVTGFILMSLLGSTAIMVSVALLLALTAALVRPGVPVFAGSLFVVTVALVILVGNIGAPASVAALSHGDVIYARDTAYQTVSVAWDSETGTHTVVLDNLVHGFVVPTAPEVIYYPYIAAYAAVYESFREVQQRPLVSLHLGGGAYTLPRYVAATFDTDRIIVSEIDPGVTAANTVAARLSSPPPFELEHADAREVVRTLRDRGEQVDVVFGDAFTDYAIPAHLATVQFYRELDAILTPSGVVMQNVIDDLSRPAMLASLVATIEQVHEFVQVIALSSSPTSGGRDTFIILSSRRSVSVESALERLRVAGVQASVVPLAVLESGTSWRAHVLTDDFAPVEMLVSHLYR